MSNFFPMLITVSFLLSLLSLLFSGNEKTEKTLHLLFSAVMLFALLSPLSENGFWDCLPNISEIFSEIDVTYETGENWLAEAERNALCRYGEKAVIDEFGISDGDIAFSYRYGDDAVTVAKVDVILSGNAVFLPLRKLESYIETLFQTECEVTVSLGNSGKNTDSAGIKP